MTTKPLVRFWKALDEIPDATTDQREWSFRLKDDWPAATSFLKKVGRRAKEIACPSPGGDGCPRKVVEHAEGRFRAVCGNRPAECDSIDVTREEIACLALDRKKLAAAVGAMFNAAPESSGLESGVATLIGSHAVAAGIGIPVILMTPGPAVAEVSLDMLAGVNGPAAIVTPTPHSLTPCLKRALEAKGYDVLSLSEFAGLDDRHRLIGLLPADQLLAPLRQKLLANQTLAPSGRIWILPADTRWEDLTFEFTAEEVVNVRFRKETRRYEPEKFGMKNKKNGRPTLAWTILRTLAQQAGALTWKGAKASTRVKKQKQLLSGRLTSLFGIQDDPIPWRPAQKAYVARFAIRDSTPDSAYARSGRR